VGGKKAPISKCGVEAASSASVSKQSKKTDDYM